MNTKYKQINVSTLMKSSEKLMCEHFVVYVCKEVIRQSFALIPLITTMALLSKFVQKEQSNKTVVQFICL